MKSANVTVRVEPDVKEKAEAILSELGIPTSTAINMFYRQIVLWNGLPFRPAKPPIRPLSRDEMTDERADGGGDGAGAGESVGDDRGSVWRDDGGKSEERNGMNVTLSASWSNPRCLFFTH